MSEAIEQGGYGQIKAVLVSRHGELIYEEYFRGTKAQDLHQVHSVTKSVGSALIGIAHRKNLIELDQGMADFFGDLYPVGTGAYTGKQLITVESVLQQRLGITWDEWSVDYLNGQNPVTQAIISGDWYQYVLSQPMSTLPGTEFAYNTMGSNMMSRMIRKVSGQSPRDFAMQELFGPLGVVDIHWEGYSQQGRGFGMTQFPNPDGDEPLGFMLWLKARDMLKFGELYLNGGTHEGQRILDSSWIEASWTKYSHSGNTPLFEDSAGSGYGYQWWALSLEDERDRSWDMNYANGWGRQFILVIPALDMVVVSLADDYDYDGPGIGALLSSFILNESEITIPINSGLNDAWVSSEAPFQGMFITVFPFLKRIFLAWFTFDSNNNGGQAMTGFGAPDQRWVTAFGSYQGGTAELKAELTSGGMFNAATPVPVQDTEYGTINIRFSDCNRAILDFDFPAAGQSGQMELARAVVSNVSFCESLIEP